MDQERAANHAAYLRLKGAIARTYKHGRFVAIAGGLIIADADGFDDLRSRVAAVGKDSAEVLVIQAGVEYPESAVIFATDHA